MANIANQMVQMLVKAGIKRIYALTGDSLNEVNDAVRREDFTSTQKIRVK